MTMRVSRIGRLSSPLHSLAPRSLAEDSSIIFARLDWLRRRFFAVVLFVIGVSLASGVIAQTICTAARHPDEAPFLAANEAAMSKMIGGMTVKPAGDVDTDFAAMMIPHHQGAIDMAVAELRFGHNEKLRRIAQEIIVDQQQEIAAMRLALNQKQAASEPASIVGGADAPQTPDASRQPMTMPMEHAR